MYIHGLKPGPMLMIDTPYLFWFWVGALTLALCYPLGRELLGRRGAPWVVAGAAPFGAPKERTNGLPMVASLGAKGPQEAALAGLDHF